jgi:hypothetical protein
MSLCRNTEFSDMSDNELMQASAVTVAAVGSKPLVKLEFSDISDDELIRQAVDSASNKPKKLFQTASFV